MAWAPILLHLAMVLMQHTVLVLAYTLGRQGRMLCSHKCLRMWRKHSESDCVSTWPWCKPVSLWRHMWLSGTRPVVHHSRISITCLQSLDSFPAYTKSISNGYLAQSHYLNKWWQSSQICASRLRWVSVTYHILSCRFYRHTLETLQRCVIHVI